MIIDIFIPGKPVPQGRVRFARTAKGVRTYDPKDSAYYKNWLKLHIINKYSKYPADMSLHFELIVYIVRPKSVKREHPTVKPDLDNYIKTVWDALNGELFEDQQIVSVAAVKKYTSSGSEQGIQIKIMGANV